MNIVRKYTYLRNKDGEKKGSRALLFLLSECICSKEKTGISKVFRINLKNMYEKHHILLNICEFFYIIHIEKKLKCVIQ